MCFNTQPPKGGWQYHHYDNVQHLRFNTQPPKGGWLEPSFKSVCLLCFNTQPPKGGWSPSQKPCSVRFHSPDFAKLPRKARTRV